MLWTSRGGTPSPVVLKCGGPVFISRSRHPFPDQSEKTAPSGSVSPQASHGSWASPRPTIETQYTSSSAASLPFSSGHCLICTPVASPSGRFPDVPIQCSVLEQPAANGPPKPYERPPRSGLELRGGHASCSRRAPRRAERAGRTAMGQLRSARAQAGLRFC